MNEITDRIALIDLDGTIADYDAGLETEMRRIQAPSEEPYTNRYDEFAQRVEIEHIEARRKLIQQKPGFWSSLPPLQKGFDIVNELRKLEFGLHVLTKGPRSTHQAWSEKVTWCSKWIPDALVTVTSDKSLVYGRVLVDDFPPYFMKWLEVRPRGLVVCVAHEWNKPFARGGSAEHPNVFRYDGTNKDELTVRLLRAREREAGTAG